MGSKKKALDYLFSIIKQNLGVNLAWFIDNQGFLQTFDVSNPGAVTLYIDVTAAVLDDLDFSDNSENVINQITAYGGVNDSISVTVSDPVSISRYGLKEGPDLQDSSITNLTDLTAAANTQLALNVKPVYTATVVIPQFPGAVSGQPIQFVNHPKFGSTVFIISDIVREGSPGNYKTTITATTDLNVLSPLQSFEMVQVVAKDVVANNLPFVGILSGVNGDKATVETVGGTVAASILNSNSSSNGSNSSSGGGGDSGLYHFKDENQ